MDTYQYDFAFDVSGARRPGVYWRRQIMDKEDESFSWHLDDFCSWLSEVTVKEGVYERPDLD
jgi:hypothetical protein